MNNTCKPFNSKSMAQIIDIGIIYENYKFTVLALTDEFNAINLGIFDFVLDAYACCLEHGFEVLVYEIPVSPYENRQVEITFD